MSLRIFISHAKEDRIKALKLYDEFKYAGFEPWIDEHDLLPGERWELIIPGVISKSDIFIACMSKTLLEKRGYVQAELRFAYDEAMKVPDHLVYIIPLRFDDCEVPFQFRKFTWVDCFNQDDTNQLIRKLKIYRQKTQESPTVMSSSDIIESYRPRLKTMDTIRLLAMLTEQFRADEQHPAYCLLSSIVRLNGVDLRSHGMSPQAVKQIEQSLTLAQSDAIVEGTALLVHALIMHDYYESRHLRAVPSSSELLAEIRQKNREPDWLLVGQLRPSRQFTFKSKTL